MVSGPCKFATKLKAWCGLSLLNLADGFNLLIPLVLERVSGIVTFLESGKNASYVWGSSPLHGLLRTTRVWHRESGSIVQERKLMSRVTPCQEN